MSGTTLLLREIIKVLPEAARDEILVELTIARNDAMERFGFRDLAYQQAQEALDIFQGKNL